MKGAECDNRDKGYAIIMLMASEMFCSDLLFISVLFADLDVENDSLEA